jgi:DNA-binding SARP family transcriptional activator
VSTPSAELTADVFDRFPNGILICERGGGIVAANRRAHELLGLAPVMRAGQRTCCSVLGCGARGPLERGCVCELALDGADGVQQLRVERDGRELSVRAVRLLSAPPRVVIEVRAEAPATPQPLPTLRIHALGRLRVECEGKTLTGAWVDQRAGQLLRCLVCERHRVVPTEVLAEAIWRQAGPGAPNTVRHSIHTLRERLEPGRSRHGASAFVVSRRGGYALDPERVWIDVDEFEADVAGGRRAVAADEPARARACFERAVAAYTGDFLSDDPYAEWALPEREHLRALLAAALRSLAGLSRREPEDACRYLERLASLEPFDNDTARELISAWMRLGRRSRAVRFYQAFQLRLMREFGDKPDFRIADVAGGRNRELVAAE